MADEPILNLASSSAFVFLDGLVQSGRLHETRANALKDKFKQLHDRVVQIHTTNPLLLVRAKSLRKDLESEKLKVEKCGEVARQDDQAIQTLKRELAVSENELAVAQEKQSISQIDVIDLERRKQSLHDELEEAIAVELARVEPTIEATQAAVNDIKASIENLQQRTEALAAEREATMALEERLTGHAEEAEAAILQLQINGKSARDVERVKRQANVVEMAATTHAREMAAVNERLATAQEQLQQLQARRADVRMRQELMTTKAQKADAAVEERRSYARQVEVSLQKEREQTARLQQRERQLSAALQQLQATAAATTEAIGKLGRGRDSDMREYLREQQRLETVTAERLGLEKAVEHAKKEKARVTSSLKATSQAYERAKDSADLVVDTFMTEEARHEKLIREVAAATSKAKGAEATLAETVGTQLALERQVRDAENTRERKAREAAQAQQAAAAVLETTKVRKALHVELQRRIAEKRSALEAVTAQYALVKRDRSRRAQMIQHAAQTMAETQEKLKILTNEVEVLRRESATKDRLLAKLSREMGTSRSACETVRVEAHRLIDLYRSKRQTVVELAARIAQLSSAVSQRETSMVAVRQRFEAAVEHRNFVGSQLNDRNDELCLMYERAAMQRTLLGEVTQSQASVDEKERLGRIAVANVKRSITVAQRKLGEIAKLERQLEETKRSVVAEQRDVDGLAQLVDDPTNPRFARLPLKAPPATANGTVSGAAGTAASGGGGGGGSGGDGTASPTRSGDDAAAADASAGIGDAVESALEQREAIIKQRLHVVEERLLEQNYELSGINDLCAKLAAQVEAHAKPAAELAQNLIDTQARIKAAGRRMQASLSELALVQATAMQADAVVDHAAAQLVQAKEKLAIGVEPVDGMVAEYEKKQRERRRMNANVQSLKAKQRQQEVANEQQIGRVRTTAPIRPKLFIPQTGELALPLPFGAWAPMQPTVQPNAARFYKSKGPAANTIVV